MAPKQRISRVSEQKQNIVKATQERQKHLVRAFGQYYQQTNTISNNKVTRGTSVQAINQTVISDKLITENPIKTGNQIVTRDECKYNSFNLSQNYARRPLESRFMTIDERIRPNGFKIDTITKGKRDTRSIKKLEKLKRDTEKLLKLIE